MTAEQIQEVLHYFRDPAARNPLPGMHPSSPVLPAWEIAYQLASINQRLMKLIDIELFRSPGYEEMDAKRLAWLEGRHPAFSPGDRQRQTESPQPPPEANK